MLEISEVWPTWWRPMRKIETLLYHLLTLWFSELTIEKNTAKIRVLRFFFLLVYMYTAHVHTCTLYDTYPFTDTHPQEHYLLHRFWNKSCNQPNTRLFGIYGLHVNLLGIEDKINKEIFIFTSQTLYISFHQHNFSTRMHIIWLTAMLDVPFQASTS